MDATDNQPWFCGRLRMSCSALLALTVDNRN
jgi:hypothetical protein